MTVTTPSLIHEVDIDTEADSLDEDAYDYATDDAEDSRGTAQQDLDITPSTLTSHPIQRLPTELLILVLTHAVSGDTFDTSDSFSSPFAIASICHEWREITLHTPEIWSMVHYTIRDFSLIGSEERLAGLLTIQLSRSSPLPLEVSIALYAQPRGSLWPSISALFCRARSFRLRIGRGLYEMLSSQVLCQNAPYLTHLAFNDHESPFIGDDLRLSLDAPVLRSFTFTGGCLEFPSISGEETAYPTVRAVTFHTVFTPFNFVQLVRSFPNITSLDLSWHDYSGTSFNEDDAPELELQLAHLESLTIDGRGETSVLPFEIARRLSLPSLRTARIKAKYEPGDFPWFRREEEDRRAVAALIRSALCTVRALELDLDFAGSEEDALDEDALDEATVQALELELAGSREVVDAAIVEALESCAQLEHLTFHIHRGDIEIITTKALSTPAWTVVLHVYHNHDTLSDALAIACRAASEEGLARIEVHSHLEDSDSDAQSSCAGDSEGQSSCSEDFDTQASGH